MMKLYSLQVEKVNTFNKMGKIMKTHDKHGYWRKQDWKKAYIKVDFEVEQELQKNM